MTFLYDQFDILQIFQHCYSFSLPLSQHKVEKRTVNFRKSENSLIGYKGIVFCNVLYINVRG